MVQVEHPMAEAGQRMAEINQQRCVMAVAWMNDDAMANWSLSSMRLWVE